ncbi:MAG TPA: 3-mercaptopyruvate sulfurtransferase [Methylococcaceae bacterium]|nr:3-mercaptopyruvate sulfurtransferase [Methylococcaceae bacterium]
MTDALISCEELSGLLGRADVAVLDAGFFLPQQQRNARAEYAVAHIPGAQFFDVDEIADHATSLPHMLPSPQEFAQAAGKLGIGDDTWVVVYDNNHYLASARVWWMLRVFGHDRVSVLDGGFSRWQVLGLPCESGGVEPVPRVFTPRYRLELVRDLAAMRVFAANPQGQVLDARSPGRFEGRDPESRAGLRSGHIPGARNLFFMNLVDAESGRLRAAPELAEQFRQAGIDLARPVTTTCGSGVTACILALALHELGRTDTAVYDGSWSEWGARDDTPVALGSAH